MPPANPPLALDCYIRGGSPPRPTRRLVDRIGDLVGGPDRDVAVHTWPRRIALTGSFHQRELDVYDTFSRWAEANGASLRPGFRVRTATSSITGESTTELVTPVCCVAAYGAETLAGVFPHATEAGTYSVPDLVDALGCGVALDEVSPAVGAPTVDRRSPEPDAGGPDARGPDSREPDPTEAETKPDVPEL